MIIFLVIVIWFFKKCLLKELWWSAKNSSFIELFPVFYIESTVEIILSLLLQFFKSLNFLTFYNSQNSCLNVLICCAYKDWKSCNDQGISLQNFPFFNILLTYILSLISIDLLSNCTSEIVYQSKTSLYIIWNSCLFKKY